MRARRAAAAALALLAAAPALALADWGSPREVASADASPEISDLAVPGLSGVGIAGDARAVIAFSQGSTPVPQVVTRAGRRDAPWSPASALAPLASPTTGPARVAVARSGAAVAVWIDPDPFGTRAVTVASRNPRGVWGAPVAISEGAVSDPAVAIAPSGRAVVVWVDRGIVLASLRRSRGAGFAAPEIVSSPGESADDPRIGIDVAGNAIAAWTRVGTPSQLAGPPRGVRASVLAVDGSSWATLARFAARGIVGRAQLAVGGRGDAIVSWSRGGATPRVLVATGRLPDVPVLRRSFPARSGIGAPALAVSPTGDAIVAWSDSTGVLAARRDGPGGPFAPTVRLSGSPATGAPAVGIDRRGRSLAVWFDAATDRVRSASGTPGGLFLSEGAISPRLDPSGLAGPLLAFDVGSGRAVAAWQGAADDGSTIGAAGYTP